MDYLKSKKICLIKAYIDYQVETPCTVSDKRNQVNKKNTLETPCTVSDKRNQVNKKNSNQSMKVQVKTAINS